MSGMRAVPRTAQYRKDSNMAFIVSSLPPSARAMFLQYQKCPPLWPAVIRESYRVGITDLTELTDIAFFIHHPERGGRALSLSETALISEWKSYRTTIQSWMPGAPAAPAADPKPEAPKEPTLLDLLRKVDTDAYGKTEQQRTHLARVKAFFVRALEGEVVDDAYYQFSYYDGFGRERHCSEKHSVASVSRGNRQQHALANFKRNCEGYKAVDSIARRLLETEAAVACHTFVLVRWAHQNAGTGDGSLRAYTI